jgi:hypothetical protein
MFYLVNLKRRNLKRLIKRTDSFEKTKPSVEYLNCDIEYFKQFIEKKMMTSDMN